MKILLEYCVWDLTVETFGELFINEDIPIVLNYKNVEISLMNVKKVEKKIWMFNKNTNIYQVLTIVLHNITIVIFLNLGYRIKWFVLIIRNTRICNLISACNVKYLANVFSIVIRGNKFNSIIIIHCQYLSVLSSR